ncbi:phasin PhaH [Caulobacter sp. DWR1-3-2b1]|uniref:phasin PhaH n=1 Tax=Caulobacter sp. DWR1-3-2b1 TaxID=2804670 RepID=UPI003CF9D99A
MVSTLSFFPEFKTQPVDPEAGPHLMMGAASPLWLMFGGAAAAGAAWWWWASRWREAVNLESMIALAPSAVATPMPALETVAAQAVETVEATVEAVVEPARIVAEAAVETAVETVAVANDSMVETVETVEAVTELEPAVVETVETIETVAEAATAPVVEAVEAQVEAARILADDLTRLVGIGPKLAESLGELGVTSFSQIAAWSADDLKSIDQLLNLKGRADRDAWIAQAKRFAIADA